MKLANWEQGIDLSPHRAEIESLSKLREKQKKGYRTSKQFSSDATNLTGLKGEYAFSMCTGLPVDKELRRNGDGGTDFVYGHLLYDIKSSLYDGVNVSLMEFPGKKMLAHVYVLIQIKGWSARIIGWASRRQLRHANRKNFGHGERLAISRTEMQELGQDTIPPFVPSTSTSKKHAIERAEYQLKNTDEILTLDAPVIAGDKKKCRLHGPFEVRQEDGEDWKEAMYCKSCGSFYGYRRKVYS